MSVIPGEELPEPVPAGAAKPKLVCEFCSCQLTPVGDVLRMSDVARAYAKQSEQIAQLKEQLATLRAAHETASRELTEAKARIVQLESDYDDDDDDDD